eukprot:Amastigsp_a553_134.p3 type:complete len:117 gc:universal Amastigsp_a553_134:1111-761(-)
MSLLSRARSSISTTRAWQLASLSLLHIFWRACREFPRRTSSSLLRTLRCGSSKRARRITRRSGLCARGSRICSLRVSSTVRRRRGWPRSRSASGRPPTSCVCTSSSLVSIWTRTTL